MKSILAHSYTNASDDLAAYEADKCRRQAVTVEFAFEYLVDVPLYIFRVESAERGLDGWLDVTGVDKFVAGSKVGQFTLEYGKTGERIVDGDFRVFVDRSNLDKVIPQLDLEVKPSQKQIANALLVYSYLRHCSTMQGMIMLGRAKNILAAAEMLDKNGELLA